MTFLTSITVASRLTFLIACCCFPASAQAGPEPDAGYKLFISLTALLSLTLLVSVATGCLARSLTLTFWNWFIVQFIASLTGLALFIRLLSLWQTTDDLTALDLLVTDIIFETWSTTNLLLLASLFAFTCPLLILAVYGIKNYFRSPKAAREHADDQ